MPFTVAILAGGESRRMGRDKAQLAVGAETLLERTARVALEVCPSVMVVGRARPDGWPLPDVLFLRDDAPGQGPLGGLVTALKYTHGKPVVLLACDFPLMTPNALGWLLSEAHEFRDDGQGLVAVNDGQREPLFSAYAPACLPPAEARLAAGRRSLLGLIEAGDFVFFQVPADVADALRDVDTPDDWAEVMR